MKTYDLTAAAGEDLTNIWRYTYETWGADQADRSFERIAACCDAVGEGHARSRSFDELPDDVRVLRCEHHHVVWLTGDRPIIIAILHERMDFLQRLKDRF